MAWTWRDASRSSADVYDPSGVLYLRYARHFLVGSVARRETVSSADYPEWRRVPAGCVRVLRYRLHCGNAAVVDDGRRCRLWCFGCGTAVVQFARLVKMTISSK